jgi:hypothetical protein
LYVATKLGDFLDDLVIVGGLVPSLLIDQELSSEQHVGTLDLDVGMALGLLDDERYDALEQRLRSAGFEPDRNAQGKPLRQRWRLTPERVTVDFLIPPSRHGDRGGKLRNLTKDLAAIIAPGLQLAFHDRVEADLSGTTIRGGKAERKVWVCGPAAFVAMKALAYRNRAENKDAYDLFYLLRNHRDGVEAIGRRLRELCDSQESRDALRILDEDFASPASIGPISVAEFVSGGLDENLQADAWALVRELLEPSPD